MSSIPYIGIGIRLSLTTPRFGSGPSTRALLALQKIEVNNNGGGQNWTICFASVAQEIVTAQWPEARRYASTAPGLRFKEISKTDTSLRQPEGTNGTNQGDQKAFHRPGRLHRREERRDRTGPHHDAAFRILRPGIEVAAGRDIQHGGRERRPKSRSSVVHRGADRRRRKMALGIRGRQAGNGRAQWRLDGAPVLTIPAVRTTEQVFDIWTFYVMPRDFK